MKLKVLQQRRKNKESESKQQNLLSMTHMTEKSKKCTKVTQKEWKRIVMDKEHKITCIILHKYDHIWSGHRLNVASAWLKVWLRAKICSICNSTHLSPHLSKRLHFLSSSFSYFTFFLSLTKQRIICRERMNPKKKEKKVDTKRCENR